MLYRVIAVAMAALVWPSIASASPSGGAGVPDAPAVASVKCVASADVPCTKRALVRGGMVRLRGAGLAQARKVVFLGARTSRDDVSVRPAKRDDDHVDAVVPTRAKSGRVMIVDALSRESRTRPVKVSSAPAIDAAPGSGYYVGGQRKPSLDFQAGEAGPVEVEVVRQADGAVVTAFTHQATAGANTARWNGQVGKASAASGEYTLRLAGKAAQASPSGSTPFALFDHLFPIRGKHNLGYTNTNQFGGGRGHQGIDMFAKCGTRIAAARGGKVEFAGYQSAAGNYVVIDGAGTGNDYVYMHMRSAPLVRTGQRVFTGQKLGDAGDTGRATGCHLHFEMWSAPGWYKGGKAFNTLPLLQRWRQFK